MSAAELLAALEDRGVELALHDKGLRVRAPKGALDSSLRSAVQERKSELIALLVGEATEIKDEAASDPRAVAPDSDPEDELHPDVQAVVAAIQILMRFRDQLGHTTQQDKVELDSNGTDE